MKIGNEDVKLYLGSVEVEKIYLGTEQVYEGDSTPTPSTDVPLDNTFAVKYQGMWREGYEPISYIEDIEMQLGGIGVSDPYEVEELSIGNQTISINLDGYRFENCTGLTLAPSVADTSDIHNFPAMKWVNVMGDSFEYQGGSGLFSDMNCCPIYVPEASLSDYQSAWENETTADCDGTVADRLVGWTPPTPTHDYSHDYLTFVAEADNMSVSLNYAGSNMFEYSVDSGSTWSYLADGQSTSSVNSGETIMFKAIRLTPSSSDGIGTLVPSENASVQGNVMSLVYYDDFVGQTEIFNQYQFLGLFYQGTHITSAENLILPATTLTERCYRSMFNGCTSLTTAPALPATTLVEGCYFGMFNGCTSLNYIKCLATDKSALECTQYWVSGVTGTGDFVKSASMTGWRTGVSGIPSGWRVRNDGEPAPIDYSTQYLTIESIDDNNTIYFTASNTALTRTISASTDNGTTWTAYTSSTGRTMLATLNRGDKLLLKGNNETYTTVLWTDYRTNIIESLERFNVYGNIMSLISGDSFSNADTLVSANTFYQFFQETGVVNAENLVMPATTLKNYCYYGMFQNCTAMTTAPELPATTLVQSCYQGMFSGCTSLNSITCLATNISARNSTSNWVVGVAASGTFTKAASMSSWTTGASGIPNGWTIQ